MLSAVFPCVSFFNFLGACVLLWVRFSIQQQHPVSLMLQPRELAHRQMNGDRQHSVCQAKQGSEHELRLIVMV
jgi:hypothetical protein